MSGRGLVGFVGGVLLVVAWAGMAAASTIEAGGWGSASEETACAASEDSGGVGVGAQEGGLTVVGDVRAGQVVIAAPGADQVDVAVKPLTVGEALAFLGGGEPRVAAAVSETLSGSGSWAGGTVDLRELVARGTGLLAVDAQATAGGAPLGAFEGLMQLGPIGLTARWHAGAVRVRVTDVEGQPVGGALLELLDADGRRVGMAESDLAGDATLAAAGPSGEGVLGSGLFVCAGVGRHRALARVQ